MPIAFILVGIVHRLIFALFFNNIFDFRNILALVKSVADTGDLTAGFFVLKKSGLEVQLYGKIYYQIAAAWLQILNTLKLIDIRYLFDVKPYDNPFTYLVGLGQWTPPLYQLIAIKLSQFFYDFILLFFLYRLGGLLELKNKHFIILLWALNPFLIFSPYAMYQSDLAMLAFLTAGIYFAIRGFQNSQGSNLKFKILSLLFFATGSVIKQVPILIVPFVLLLFSNSILNFLFFSSIFSFFYLLLSQPWSQDASLLKQFFLSSKESLALFNFQLNSVPIFLLLYFSFFFFFFFKGKEFFKKPLNLLCSIVIIIALIYIGESADLLFPQFNMWIMPFLILLLLVKNEYSIFMIFPIIGFFKRSMIDSDFLTGALSETLGKKLADIPNYEKIFNHLINPDLITYFLNTITILGYILLIVLIFREFFQRTTTFFFIQKIKLNYKKIILILFISYYIFLGIDYFIKSKYVILSGKNYQETNDRILLKNNSRSIIISNPLKNTIHALEFKAFRKQINYHDNLVFKFTNLENGKVLLEQKFFDYYFSNSENSTVVFLKRGVSQPKVKLELFKETKQNEVEFVTAKVVENPNSDDLLITFLDRPFYIKFRGQYPYSSSFITFLKHLHSKPKFFTMYFLTIIFLLILMLLLLRGRYSVRSATL